MALERFSPQLLISSNTNLELTDKTLTNPSF
jgi:hypothetical protein